MTPRPTCFNSVTLWHWARRVVPGTLRPRRRGRWLFTTGLPGSPCMPCHASEREGLGLAASEKIPKKNERRCQISGRAHSQIAFTEERRQNAITVKEFQATVFGISSNSTGQCHDHKALSLQKLLLPTILVHGQFLGWVLWLQSDVCHRSAT